MRAKVYYDVPHPQDRMLIKLTVKVYYHCWLARGKLSMYITSSNKLYYH